MHLLKVKKSQINLFNESTLSDSTVVTGEVSDFTKVEYDPHTPARTVLYNATVSPYNATTDSNDNTSAIQKALNQASNDGGGIVFYLVANTKFVDI